MECPSGDHCTCHPSPMRDRSTRFEPSRSTMCITWSPVRLELKPIRLASGDHEGYSPPSVFGTRCCPDPSAFMIEIPLNGGYGSCPGLAYAIVEPSGDHAGEIPAVSRR